MNRRQGSPGLGKEENETLLINDLSKQMDLQVSRAQKERGSSLNGWHPGRTDMNGHANEEREDTTSNSMQDGSGLEEQPPHQQQQEKQEDDFFSQYLGKSSFNFNATADLMKEMEQMHTSTGYVRGFEDSAIENERRARPPSPTVAALLHSGPRNSVMKNYHSRDDDASLRAQLEDTTRALVREKGINAERENELGTLQAQLAEERRKYKDRVADVERELASLRAQAQEARRSAQELEKQRDGWRTMVTERENALKAAQRQSAEARERFEQERENWKRAEEDKQRRFEDELAEARMQLQSEWERERLRWRAKEETKEKEIALLTSRTQETAEDIMRERSDAEDHAAALRSEVDLLRAQLEDRDAHIEELQAREGEFENVTSVFNTENETMLSKTRGLEHEIERGRKEIEKLRNEVREKDVTLMDLEHQTQEQASELERLQREIEELKKEIPNKPTADPTNQKELDVLRERLHHQGEVMKRTEEMHRNQLGELQRQLQLLIEQYQAVDLDRSQQFEDLQDENAKLHADNTQLHAVNTEVLAANAQMQTENARLHSESAKVQAESSKFQADSTKFQAESAKLQAENARLHAEHTKSHSEKAKLQAEVARLSQECKDLSAQRDDAVAQIDERDRVIVSLRDQIEELTMDKNESEQAVDALRAHVTELARGKDTAIAAMQAQAARLGQEKEVLTRKLDDLRSQPIVEPKELVRRSFSASPVPPASPPPMPASPNISRSLARTPSPTHTISAPTFPMPPRTPGRTPHFNLPPPSARPLPPHPASQPPPPRPAFATDPVLYIHQQLQNLHERQQQQQQQNQHQNQPQQNQQHQNQPQQNQHQQNQQPQHQHQHPHFDSFDDHSSSPEQYDGFMEEFHTNYDPPAHHPAPYPTVPPSRPSMSHATPHKPAFNPSLYPPYRVETAPSTSIPSLYNQPQEDDRYPNLQQESQFLPPRPGSHNFNPSTSPHPAHQDPFQKYRPNHQNVQYANPSRPSHNTPYNPPQPHYGYDYPHNPPLENVLHHVMNSRAHQPPSFAPSHPPSFAPSHPPSFAPSHPPSSHAPATRNPTSNKSSQPHAKPANAARPTSATRNAPAPRTKATVQSTVRRTSAPISHTHAPTRQNAAPTKARNSPRLWK